VSLTNHLPVLIVVIPLMAAALTPIVGNWRKNACFLWASGAILISFLMSIFVAARLYFTGPISYHLGGWKPPWGIEIFFDNLSALSLALAGFGFLIILFSQKYAEKALGKEKIPTYYTLLLLNLAGMIGFVITGDLFNLFVFMEIISLSAYALTAISGEKLAEMAGFKYLLLGAVSSLSILMAIAFLYSITGTLNMRDLSLKLQETRYLTVASTAFALMVMGFSVKAAIFPLHIWLPDAHSIAPSPVSAILSGLVVKTGIIGLLRTIQIFKLNGNINITPILTLLSWLGVASLLMGAFFAFFQDDIKMMLAYSTISNIGYIYLGIGLGSYYSLIGGIIHIFEHALIKVLLFLCAGSIIHQTGFRRLSELRGVGRRMPVTSTATIIAAVSIVGIPPTNGFIGKWFLALGAIQAEKPFFAAALLLGALFIFAYYMKMINAFYFREPLKAGIIEAEEAPWSMRLPMMTLAALCLLFGILAFLPLAFVRPAVEGLLGLAR